MSDLVSSLADLLKRGCHSEVIQCATDAGVTPGRYPLASKLLAISYFQLGEHRSAYELLIDLESTYSDDVDYLTLFASTCRRLGKFDQSSDLFSRALAKQPDSLPIKNNYSNLLIDLGRYDEAVVILDSILSIV